MMIKLLQHTCPTRWRRQLPQRWWGHCHSTYIIWISTTLLSKVETGHKSRKFRLV